MPPTQSSDLLLVERIRRGEEAAWDDLIARFEGRLLAFVESRLRDRSVAEDVVQETFVGFLKSAAHFDDARPLETFLFSIAAHKLTDHLRREGRRPALPMSAGSHTDSQWDIESSQRGASSILRSGERKQLEADAIRHALADEIRRWRERGDWTKLKCLELLFVRGRANKEVAATAGVTEQQVANYKFDFLTRLRSVLKRQELPEDVFPELS